MISDAPPLVVTNQAVAEAADAILERGRIWETDRLPDTLFIGTPAGVVYAVTARAHRIECRCAAYATQKALCAHIVAAMLHWHERIGAEVGEHDRRRARLDDLDAELAELKALAATNGHHSPTSAVVA